MGPEGIEAVGEAVTGGMIGRAVEPGAGEAHDAGHGACLNCGADLTGQYCHACGQAAHVHRTLGAFWHDLAHSVLHFEGKIWRTLPLLAWRPGELTRRYVEGQRASFVSPMALFLFSVFVMFAVFSWVGGPIGVPGQQQTGELVSSTRKTGDRLQDQLARLERQRADAVARNHPTTELDRAIAETREGIAALAAVNAATRVGERGVSQVAAEEMIDIETNGGWFDRAYKKAKENPSLLLYKLQSNGYKFSWLLIPLSVPFVALLFLHRRRYRQFRAYDHVVFVTYSLCFMTLLIVALSLLRGVGMPAGWAVLALSFIPPVHMYRQLKGAYGLSRRSALWRTFVLVWFATIVLSLFMLILVLLGVMG